MVAAPDSGAVSLTGPTDIAHWRAEIFSRLLTFVLVLGAAVAVPSVMLAASEGLWLIVGTDIVAIAWLFALWRLPQLSYTARVINFLTIAYLVGTALLIKGGLVSQIYLCAVPVLAALLLGLRPAMWWLGAAGLAVLLFGHDLLATLLSGQSDTRMLLKSIVIAINFLFITGLITLSCGLLLRHLANSLDALRATNAAMQEGQQKVHQLAFYDVLTGLPNKRMLVERITTMLTTPQRAGSCGAVLFVDLDNFKDINDARGHAVGDAILRHAAERLGAVVRKSDTVARTGGDEFVVLLACLPEESEPAGRTAMAVAEKIRCAIAESFQVDGHAYQSSASIGVTMLTQSSQSADDLLREADTAMYRAKAEGRNAIVFFEGAMQAQVEQRLSMARDLLAAFEGGQMQMHYQAQVDRYGTVVGAELLMRWRRSDGSMVPPAVFIPIAEQSGLIERLGHWALREACQAVLRLQAAGWPLALSVNVSPNQFRQKDFVEQVRRTLADSGAPAHLLILEVTEGLLIDNLDETIGRMAELAGMGLRFSIDDFGTGYSSLAYLRKMPLYELKIDRSFINDVPDNPGGVAIVQSILSMARHLGLRVVAEGVETAAQSSFLSASECDCMQGYLFARPAPFSQLLETIAKPAALA